MIWIIGGMLLALVGGVYVGLGAPGVKGREDRVVEPGRARRLPRQRLDLLRQNRRR